MNWQKANFLENIAWPELWKQNIQFKKVYQLILNYYLLPIVFSFEGVKALSEFHTHFVDSLQSITRSCVAKRDTLMKKLLEAKDNGMNKTTASTADNTSLNSPKHGQSEVS